MPTSSPAVTGARWSTSLAALGERAELVATLEPADQPAVVTFVVSQYLARAASEGGGYARRELATVTVPVEADAREAVAHWTVAAEADGVLEAFPAFRFTASAGESMAASPLLEVGAVEQATWVPAGGDADVPASLPEVDIRLRPDAPIEMLLQGRGLSGFEAEFEAFAGTGAARRRVAVVPAVPVVEGVARAAFAPPPGAAGPFSFRAALTHPAARVSVAPPTAEPAESACPTGQNVYIYVVGSDYEKATNFHCMKDVLAQQSRYRAPWLELTYDYQPTEKGAAPEFVYVSMDRQGKTTRGKNTISKSIVALYQDILALSKKGDCIRELHFLTHSNQYGPVYEHCVLADPRTLYQYFTTGDNQTLLRSAFAKGAYIKLYGCLFNTSIGGMLVRYCTRKQTAAERLKTLVDIRAYVAASYAFTLAGLTKLDVWAAPLGVGASFSCPYSMGVEINRQFCIDPVTYARQLKYYAGNYAEIFTPDDGERFDSTYHMRYRRALNLDPTPRDCAARVPLRGSAFVPTPAKVAPTPECGRKRKPNPLGVIHCT